MKRYPSHLILLKGEDRTAEVAKFTYEKGRPFVRVTFRSGGSFRYSASNFAAFKGVETELLDGKALLLDGNLRLDVYGVQEFGKPLARSRAPDRDTQSDNSHRQK